MTDTNAAAANGGARLEANADEIARFFDRLLRHAEDGTYISLRGFYHGDARPAFPAQAVKLNGAGFGPLVAEAARLATFTANLPGGAVFSPPACTFANAKGAGMGDVANGLAIVAELDARPEAGRVLAERLLGRPGAVVRSGGTWHDPETGEVQDKLHLYWLLNEPTTIQEEHAKLQQANTLLKQIVGGDGTAAAPCHPLRCPGSWHTKGEPRPCELVEVNDADIDLGDALDLLEAYAREHSLEAEAKSAGRQHEADGDARRFDAADLMALAEAIPNDYPNRDDWLAFGFAFKASCLDDAAGLEAFDHWSRKWGDGYDAAETARVWRTAKPKPNGAGALKLLKAAHAAVPGFRLPSEVAAAAHGAELAEAIMRSAKAKAENVVHLDEARAARASTGGAEPAPEPEPPPPPVGIDYNPALVLQPGGVLQELVEWMTSTTKRPQPELALGGAVALLGLLCAHRYRVVHDGNDTRSNVIIVGLAGSASGKDHPRRCVKAILAKLGMSDFVGEDLASGQALEGTFVKYFAHLFLVDEYGHRLAAALNPKGNPNEKRIVDVITKLSTSGAGPYTQTRMAVHRDCDCPVHLTWDPCLVMFNTTVEEPLWGGMGSGHVNDGSMARHLFFKSGNDYPDNVRGVPHFEERLPEMVERAERVIGASQGNVALFSHIASLKACYTEPDKKGSRTRLQPLEPQLITLPVDADAAAELDCLSDEQTVMLRQADSCGALIGRMVEHATRLALICAVSESPEAPTMTARHVLWGEAVAKWSLDTALRAAAEHVADTPHQANRNKLLRDVRRVSKGGWVTARDVTRASTWSNSRDRGLLLFELVDLGLIEKRPATRVSGQATSEYRCRS